MQAPHLVFLHGFPFNSDSWQPQMQHFKPKFDVLAPDLRGHRSGPKGPGPWMIAHYVDDLKKMLESKKIEKVILCGVSMGGYIALQFVAHYPDFVHALILSDTQAAPDSNDAKDKRYLLVERIQREGLHLFAAENSKSVLAEFTLTNKPGVQKNVEAMILTHQKEDVAQVIGALASRKDSTPLLASIKCPTLVVVGAQDKTIPVEASEILAKSIAKAQFEKIENAGHLPNLEQPVAFNDVVDRFLKGL